MDSEHGIFECYEDAYPPCGKIPPTLKEVGIARILNRRILRREPKGNCGNGGAGFFGIQLENNYQFPKEWLFLAYYGSYGWIWLNGEPEDPEERNPGLPGEPILAVIARSLGPLSFLVLPIVMILRMLSQMTKPQGNSDWSKLVGAKISEVDVTESHTAITVESYGALSILETPCPGPIFPRGRMILKVRWPGFVRQPEW